MGAPSTIMRLDFRVMRRDPGPLIVLIGMPLVLMSFVRPMFEGVLRYEGFLHANGAEQAVPGMATMFGFYLLTYVSIAIFREHGSNTWERLLATPARPLEILLGKVTPLFLLGLVQQFVLFTLGSLLFHLKVEGSLVALAMISVALVTCLVAMGLALASVCRTVQQVNAFGNLLTILLGGLGGSLAPTSLLPAWAAAIAPFTPGYWAMRGFRSVILNGVAEVLPSVGVLFAFAVAFTVIAARRFDFSETKIFWA
jgi:ABC-2 type transport system permease protein